MPHRIAPVLRWRTIAALLAVALLGSSCAGSARDTGSPATGSPAASPAATGDIGTPGLRSAPGQSQPATASAPSSAASPVAESPEPGATTTLSAYFLVGERLVPVARQVPRTVTVARAAMNELLSGPSDAEASATPALLTVIPAGTRLLDVAIANGIATVDLTSEFASGGGSASMFARLAQVVYTLTQFPTVKGVDFRIDGRPVTTFSSEGIVLDGPSVRGDFQGNLPAIFVDRPAWGSVLPNPARIAGVANVFEARFIVEIAMRDGTLLASEPVMAACGTGCWGTFDVTVPYAVDRPTPGLVTVYDLSARDGSRENVRSYPVTLTPGG